MTAKNRLLPLGLVATSLLAAACGRDHPSAGPGGPAGPRRGGTVVTGWSAAPGGVNELILPASNVNDEILYRVFLHLVEEQPDFEHHPPTFAPQLARSYEWSADHKTLTFHLRESVTWSDGVPVTADDVRWTWQAQISPDIGWDNAFMKQAITDVEAVDPHTVRFHFSRVYAKQLLDVNEGLILPRHVWGKIPFKRWRESSDWFRHHLVVDGPFTIASWETGQELVLRRNDRYFDKSRPYLDRMVLRVFADQSSLMTQLFSGEVDFVPQISPADAARVKADPKLELISYWFRLNVVVAWNGTNPLFADPEVRRALTLAIDRQTIVDTLWGPYGRVAVSPIVAAVWAHDSTLRPLPYDPAEARRILAAKGWQDTDGDGILDRNGRPFAFELTSNTGNQQRNDAAVMIQDQLKKIGIRVQPRVVEFNTLMAQSDSGRFDATIIGLGMDTSLDLTAYFHSKSIPVVKRGAVVGSGNNFFRYSNPEVDRLIEQAGSQPEIVAAKPYLDRIQQILHRDQPLTFLWESQRLNAVNRRVRNAKPNMLFSLFNLSDWWVEPGAGPRRAGS
jgi:peptide/nickel transport system substrate-binding protein